MAGLCHTGEDGDAIARFAKLHANSDTSTSRAISILALTRTSINHVGASSCTGGL